MMATMYCDRSCIFMSATIYYILSVMFIFDFKRTQKSRKDTEDVCEWVPYVSFVPWLIIANTEITEMREEIWVERFRLFRVFCGW